MALSQGVQLHSKAKLLPKLYKKSVLYHDIFEYPLKKEELSFWRVGNSVKSFDAISKKVEFKKGFYFVLGKEESIIKRLLNEKISKSKIKIAKRASRILFQIPSIQMVGLTGSLAMLNAREDSDIDLMIIVSEGTLWMTRIIAYLTLLLTGFTLRRARDKNEKDKLCLNIWLDETDLKWRRKNIFTAHEVLQMNPLKNKNSAYEKFIEENKWSLNFWPNALKQEINIAKNTNRDLASKIIVSLLRLFEPIAFWFEYNYMKRRITKETITPTRALFHPYDWSNFVNSKIKPF